jgi:hypothetical protein
MTKRVTVPDDPVIKGEDMIANDDDLLLNDYSEAEASQDGRAAGSGEDVSDYEGNPKGAPPQAYFGLDRCRSQFQLNHDCRDQIVRVCGGGLECCCKGHKSGESQGPVGIYDTITTRNYCDGILSTHRTALEQAHQNARRKDLLQEAAAQLTGSQAYQAQLDAIAAEEGMDDDASVGTGDGDNQDHGAGSGWDFESEDEDEDVKMPARTSKKLPPTKNKTSASTTCRRAPMDSDSHGELANLVVEVRERRLE